MVMYEEHEKEEKEAKKASQPQTARVFHFRGIHFDEWLSLVMEVSIIQCIGSGTDLLTWAAASMPFCLLAVVSSTWLRMSFST